MTADIPARVQQPAPGLFASVTNVGVDIGPNKTTVKKTVKVPAYVVTINGYVVTINGCPGGSRSYGVDLHLVPNPGPPAQEDIGATATSPCSTR